MEHSGDERNDNPMDVDASCSKEQVIQDFSVPEVETDINDGSGSDDGGEDISIDT